MFFKTKKVNDDLLKAAVRDDLNAVIRLIARGADVNIRDSDGRTALMYASLEGYLTVIDALLAKGANVNAVK